MKIRGELARLKSSSKHAYIHTKCCKQSAHDGEREGGADAPALVEIGQHMGEGELHELEAKGKNPKQPVVAQDDGLAPPELNHPLVNADLGLFLSKKMICRPSVP